MLPPVNYSQVEQLQALATGPFSYVYFAYIPLGGRVPARKPLTDYLTPDGRADWSSCPAEEWLPELAGFPPTWMVQQ